MIRRATSGMVLLLAMAGPALSQARNTVAFAIFENPEAHHGCIVRERSRDGGLDALTLGRCDDPAGLFVFDEQAKRVRSASNPKLCMSDTTGAGDAPFNAILRDCSDSSFGQFYTYNRNSKRIVSLDSSTNRENRDSFCYFIGQQRGKRTPILNEPCSGRMAKVAQVVFFLTPGGVGASTSPTAQQQPAPPAAAPPMSAPPQAAAQPTRTPWGKAGAWTIDSSNTPSGFSACRAARNTDSGEIRIGLNAALDMTMSTPADRTMAPPGTRANVKLRVGADNDSVPGSVSAEGRLGFPLPPPLARTMVERPPREMMVEGPDGLSLVPLAGFRAVWDELNACVSAKGRR